MGLFQALSAIGYRSIYDKMLFERTDMEAIRKTFGDAKNIMYGSYTYETLSALKFLL
ncbi:MAG: hypothetical protein SOZ18_00870 [Phocaeicola sp.]|nr:hypothetical protein [Phocaeicola sp.]